MQDLLLQASQTSVAEFGMAVLHLSAEFDVLA